MPSMRSPARRRCSGISARGTCRKKGKKRSHVKAFVARAMRQFEERIERHQLAHRRESGAVFVPTPHHVVVAHGLRVQLPVVGSGERSVLLSGLRVLRARGGCGRRFRRVQISKLFSKSGCEIAGKARFELSLRQTRGLGSREEGKRARGAAPCQPSPARTRRSQRRSWRP